MVVCVRARAQVVVRFNGGLEGLAACRLSTFFKVRALPTRRVQISRKRPIRNQMIIPNQGPIRNNHFRDESSGNHALNNGRMHENQQDPKILFSLSLLLSPLLAW